MSEPSKIPCSLDLAKLRSANAARAYQWNGGNPPPLSFNLMELAGEAGEACNAGKKLARHEYGFVGGDPDVSKLAEELADVVICADLAAEKAGIDLAEAVVQKFNKTSVKHAFPQRLSAATEAQPTREQLIEQVARLKSALKLWVDFFDERDAEDALNGDARLSVIRNWYHGERIRASRAALAGGAA